MSVRAAVGTEKLLNSDHYPLQLRCDVRPLLLQRRAFKKSFKGWTPSDLESENDFRLHIHDELFPRGLHNGIACEDPPRLDEVTEIAEKCMDNSQYQTSTGNKQAAFIRPAELIRQKSECLRFNKLGLLTELRVARR